MGKPIAWLSRQVDNSPIHLNSDGCQEFHLEGLFSGYAVEGRCCARKLILSLTHSLTKSLTLSLTHSHTRSLTPSLTHSLTHSITHSLTHSFANSLTHSLTHSLTLSSLTHWWLCMP